MKKPKLNAKIITLYPELFPGPLAASVTGRALKNKIWNIETINLRDFGKGRHKKVDDKPASTWEQAQFVCEILSLNLPENTKLGTATLSEKQKEFYKEMKLVKNDLIKKKLGYKLLYPSYKDGFRSILGL